MATLTDFETVLRRVLNEGTARGQTSWSSTSKATLAAVQHVANVLYQQVIPPLEALAAAQNGGAPATPAATEASPAAPAADPLDPPTADENDATDQQPEYSEDAGVQQLDQAATDDTRQAIEAGLLVETDNGPHGDDEDVSQEPEAHDDNG